METVVQVRQSGLPSKLLSCRFSVDDELVTLPVFDVTDILRLDSDTSADDQD